MKNMKTEQTIELGRTFKEKCERSIIGMIVEVRLISKQVFIFNKYLFILKPIQTYSDLSNNLILWANSYWI